MTVRQTIHDKVAERLAVYQQAALAIHAHPETSNHEYFAQETLTKLLADDGFTVTKDVAGHPTGFAAVYKSAKPGPVIVFLAEYGALRASESAGPRIDGEVARVCAGRH